MFLPSEFNAGGKEDAPGLGSAILSVSLLYKNHTPYKIYMKFSWLSLKSKNKDIQAILFHFQSFSLVILELLYN